MTGTIIERVIDRSGPVIVAAESAEAFMRMYPGAANQKTRWQSSIGVPIHSRGVMTGMVFAHSSQRNSFSIVDAKYLDDAFGG